MADFDLTQTDAQVQSILNDGQNMQGAGAQTTLTTESVLLKDVNGNYHKILKSSFTEAIRDTLAGLLVNNDKGTTINQIAAIASGDFGSITPANLASVLGARGSVDNFDITITPGAYVVNTNTGVGFPSGAYQWGTLIVFASKLDSYVCVDQIYITNDNNGIYKRSKYWGGDWSVWYRVYDESILTDSALLSSLASALGGMIPYATPSDVDTITKTGLYKLSNTQEHAPYGWGTLVHFEGTDYSFQIYIGGDNISDLFKIRRKTGSGWRPWYDVTLTAET